MNFFDSEEFKDCLNAFCKDLPEDVKGYDSLWNLLFMVYDKGKEESLK